MREIILIIDKEKSIENFSEYVIGAFNIDLVDQKILNFILAKYSEPIRRKMENRFSITKASEGKFTISSKRISLKDESRGSVEINPKRIYMPVIGHIEIQELYNK